MKKLFGIVFVLSTAAIPLFPQKVTKVGTTAANILQIGAGARAVSMGSAFVAVADDITSMYWNPAGIARLSHAEAVFSHTRWIADISYQYAGVAVPLSNFGTLGVQASFMTMGDMERTTIAQPEGTGEFFSAGSYAVGVSYAKPLTDRFSIGVNAKYVNERIYHSSAQGVAFDVGTLFRTQLNGMVLGMSISNYGTKMSLSGRDMLVQSDIDPMIKGNNPNLNSFLETGSYDMPLLFRVGLSMDVLNGMRNNRLIVAVDALHPNNDTESMNIGFEYGLMNMLFLRGGYKTLWNSDSQEGWSFGGGLQYGLTNRTRFKLDYCYQDFEFLNDVQMFSLMLSF
jgi:opacity protein-like surface antigen